MLITQLRVKFYDVKDNKGETGQYIRASFEAETSTQESIVLKTNFEANRDVINILDEIDNAPLIGEFNLDETSKYVEYNKGVHTISEGKDKGKKVPFEYYEVKAKTFVETFNIELEITTKSKAERALEKLKD